MKKTKYLLTLLAAGTILTAGIGQAMAYFTTYVEAEGGFTIELGDKTTITETFTNWEKTLIITNEAGSQPVFVRARAYYAPASLTVVPTESTGWSTDLPNSFTKISESDKTTEDNSTPYYYYNAYIEGGKSSGPLTLKIDNLPKEVAKGDTFNVIVIYESTPVLYTDAGDPYADWTSKLVTIKSVESSAKPENNGGTTGEGGNQS